MFLRQELEKRRNKYIGIHKSPIMNKICFVIICFLLSVFHGQTQEVPVKPNWSSINARPYPQWFQDAKLGIFIHWGVYSVPAYSGKEDYGEWFLRGLMLNDSLRTAYVKKNYPPDFTYNDFAPLFKAELFDPLEWATLFEQAGAKYVVLVSKHHDGYALWPSKYARNWNSMEVGPKRDLVGDLTKAVRKTGLRMGLYYSLAEWNHPLHRWYTDPHRNIGQYVDQHMIPQFKELVSKYKPEVIFADGEWFNTAEEWHAAELIAWYYNSVGANAIVNNRWGEGSNTGFLTPEYSAGIEVTDRPWAEVRGLGRSFALNRNEKLDAYMTGTELIHFFVKAVANGGGIIINVGPKADGQIPLLQQDRLRQLGEWLKVNGEAIYGATAWEKTGEEKEVSLQRIDPNIDFNWVRNTPGKPIKEDDFTATWTGYLQPSFSEQYTFEAEADDGIRVWVNDELIIDNWLEEAAAAEGNLGTRDAESKLTGSIQLKAGERYPIKISYFETKQNAHARLFWSSQSQHKSVVANRYLYTTEDGSQNGLKAEYKSMQQYIAYTQNEGNLYAIMMEFPESQLVLPINEPTKSTTIQMVGRQGDLPWKYKNGQLIIDTSLITFEEANGKHAWTFRIQQK